LDGFPVDFLGYSRPSADRSKLTGRASLAQQTANKG
jgi:hypothetical protein